MKPNFNTTVLIAPLDWGLGHASRCIPLIRYFTKAGCKVLIAADGMQKDLLAFEFPNHTFLSLNGYRIQYTKNKRFFTLKILLQLPKILAAIKAEHQWLIEISKKYNIDAIVSDNRYGLWHASTPAIIVTHQLELNTPGFVKRIMQWMNYKLLNRFSACWIPDVQGSPNMAGKLAHPSWMPRIPAIYLGGLSRFENSGQSTVTYELLVIISGPEPQRSLLENKLLSQLENFEGKVMFVRGLPGNTVTINNFRQVAIVNHLSANELNTAFEQSNYIISRSGYTTVMDILKLKKRSILVPTPGQTEQEYLAVNLREQQWCYAIDQKSFQLSEVLENARLFPYKLPHVEMEQYKSILDAFLKALHP